MVDQIQGSQAAYGQHWAAPTPLTDDQKTQIQSILSNYDPNNVSASDAKAIFKSLREAGIGPSADVGTALSEAGFDPQQLRTLARPEGRGGHHHHHHGGEGAGPGSATAGSQGLNATALQSLKSILGQYDLSNLSADQKTSMVKQMHDAGLLQTGYSINLSA